MITMHGTMLSVIVADSLSMMMHVATEQQAISQYTSRARRFGKCLAANAYQMLAMPRKKPILSLCIFCSGLRLAGCFCGPAADWGPCAWQHRLHSPCMAANHRLEAWAWAADCKGQQQQCISCSKMYRIKHHHISSVACSKPCSALALMDIAGDGSRTTRFVTIP